MKLCFYFGNSTSWFFKDSKQRSLLGWEGNRKNYAGEFLNMVDDEFSRNDD